MLSEQLRERLEEEARSARGRAYAPYSRYRVGAAVLTDDGRVFSGANVENALYGLTLCAERVAVAQAVSSGARGFVAVVVVAEGKVAPCGACLQVLAEFCDDVEIVLVDASGSTPTTTRRLRDLLRVPFRFERPSAE